MASLHNDMTMPKAMEVDALHEHSFCWEQEGAEQGEVEAVAKGMLDVGGNALPE